MKADPILSMITGKAAPFLTFRPPRPWAEEALSDSFRNEMVEFLGQLMTRLDNEKAASGKDPKTPWYEFKDRGYPGQLSEIQKAYKRGKKESSVREHSSIG